MSGGLDALISHAVDPFEEVGAGAWEPAEPDADGKAGFDFAVQSDTPMRVPWGNQSNGVFLGLAFWSVGRTERFSRERQVLQPDSCGADALDEPVDLGLEARGVGCELP